MVNYEAIAQDFLDKCDARMTVTFVCRMKNDKWGDQDTRNRYEVTLSTPKGIMVFPFWDSIVNTQNHQRPSKYSILSCLEKYDVGSIDDFFNEFGWEITSGSDVIKFLDTYNETVKQYKDLCRIFTPEQMEMLREIY
jgi:hypothetical protein